MEKFVTKLENDDRLDINLAITTIVEANKCLSTTNGLDKLTEDQARSYYEGCCDALIEGRLLLHKLRQEFSKKYNIPYDFISKDGDIYIEVSDGS